MKIRDWYHPRKKVLILWALVLLQSSWGESAVVSRKVKLEPVQGEEGKWTLSKPARNGRAPASQDPSVGGVQAPAGMGESENASLPSANPELLPPAASVGGVPSGSSLGAGLAVGEKPVRVDMSHLPVFKELITPDMVESAYPLPLQKKRNWRLALGGDISSNLSDRQVVTLALGVEASFTDFFLRGRMGNALWGGMEVRPGTAEGVDGTTFPSYSDPDSEYNRIRLGSDPWSVMDVQFGMGWRGNLLPVIFHDFSQAFHMTVTTGQYIDIDNKLNFTPLLWGFEASSQWYLGASGAWALEGRVGYSFGSLQLVGAASNQLGRLPVRFLDAGASLVFWF